MATTTSTAKEVATSTTAVATSSLFSSSEGKQQ
jgi:hypothetical protein